MINDYKRLQDRIRIVKDIPRQEGPVVFWMQREHRVHDNWGLLAAQQVALAEKRELFVVFCLRPSFRHATERLVSFLLEGLASVEASLLEKNIPFSFLLGDPEKEIPSFVQKHNAGCLFTDFHVLRNERRWREAIAKHIAVPFYEVDARNIIPCWIASQKQEFSARIFRPKVQKLLSKYLEPFPEVIKMHSTRAKKVDWQEIYKNISIDGSVKKIAWLQPGEREARNVLQNFITNKLPVYANKRNDPTVDVQSYLSPYLHFGHISAQRVVLELYRGNQQSIDAFLDELIIRRELADNYCFYNQFYDTFEGFPEWARRTLTKHIYDKRENLYTREQLEAMKTHDDLWNAAMQQAISTGYMHGWVRMYWCKKILEWSKSPKIAQKNAIYFMDKYFLDGRESNGFTGIAWAIGGVHDRPWFERAVFGTVRYMNYNGAKRKFAIERYREIVENFQEKSAG